MTALNHYPVIFTVAVSKLNAERISKLKKAVGTGVAVQPLLVFECRVGATSSTKGSFGMRRLLNGFEQSNSDPERFYRCAGNFGINMAADMIPRFDGREAYWWLIQAEQYFGSRRMSEEMKLEWTVAFALRGDALDWWISWKESHSNTCWWNFVKAILKKFQP
ncbi:hypothetical protein KIW84_073776 [Lathyrus oleraceus]|uniref:Retrotransposon gag domain-containing protein n=1 Tax=Pisum sativum TaxID=3888 RepID=A0A9D4VS87_PEA|nr:hypothetical protein KIW84_073776 [Pisum sativum]